MFGQEKFGRVPPSGGPFLFADLTHLLNACDRDFSPSTQFFLVCRQTGTTHSETARPTVTHLTPSGFTGERASQPLFDQVQARDFLPEMHRHFAEAALIAGDLAEAEAEGQQALSLARELAMRGEEGNSLRVLGEIAAARSQWAMTEKLLGQSMAVLDEVGEKYEAARSRLALAKAYAALHQPKRARAALAECEPVFQQLDAALDLQTVRALHTALADL